MERGGSRSIYILLLSIALVAPLLSPAAPAQEGESQAALLWDRIIVGFHQVPEEVREGASFHDAPVVLVNHPLAFAVVTPQDNADFLERARGDERVAYLEEDGLLHALFTPNDPRWGSQYGPQQIGAPTVWDTTLGSTGARLCVGDTGIRTGHEDLTGPRMGAMKSFTGESFGDGHGHGTHVTGIAAATIDNGKGIAGLAQVLVLGAKVLSNSGSGAHSWVASGIQWCADQGAHVINLSLGGPGSTTLQNAVDYAWNKGSLVVAAAGNDGPCSNCIGSPANYANAIAVTATNSAGSVASFSSTGPQAELAAPGAEILSTYTFSNSNYAIGSGTSMASPHVAGAAALLFSQGPELTNAQVRELLQLTAVDKGAAGRDNAYGFGIVDVAGAFAEMIPGAPENLQALLSGDGATVTLTWDPPAQVGTNGVAEYRIYRQEVLAIDDPVLAFHDGSREASLSLDYTDDTAAVTFPLTLDEWQAVDEVQLWVQGRAYACGATGASQAVYVNRLNVVSYNPCDLFPQNGFGWVAFDISAGQFLPGDNRLSIAEFGGDWTDRNLELAMDTHSDTGATVARHDGNDLPGELLWTLVLGDDVPHGPRDLAGTVPGTSTNFTDGGLKANSTYRYTVHAASSLGEGPASNFIETTTDFEPPSVPQDVSVARGAAHGELDVSWSPPLSNGGSPIAHYRIYAGRTLDDMRLEAEPNGTSQTLTGLSGGFTYYVAVSAVSLQGEGDASAPQSAVPSGEPTRPRKVALSPGPGSRAITVTWKPPSDPGQFPLTGYRLYWGASPEVATQIAEVGPDRDFYLDTRTEVLSPGAHYYWVSAMSPVIEGPRSIPACGAGPTGHALAASLQCLVLS